MLSLRGVEAALTLLERGVEPVLAGLEGFPGEGELGDELVRGADELLGEGVADLLADAAQRAELGAGERDGVVERPELLAVAVPDFAEAGGAGGELVDEVDEILVLVLGALESVKEAQHLGTDQ